MDDGRRRVDVVRMRIRCVIETLLSICQYFSTRTQFDPNTLAMVYCESVVFVAVALHELHLAGFIVTLSHLSRVSCELVSFLAAVSCLMPSLAGTPCSSIAACPLRTWRCSYSWASKTAEKRRPSGHVRSSHFCPPSLMIHVTCQWL